MTRIWCGERAPPGTCSPTDSSPHLSHIWRHPQENFMGLVAKSTVMVSRVTEDLLHVFRQEEGPFLRTRGERSHRDKLRWTTPDLTVAHCWGRGCPSAEPREGTTSSTAPKSFPPCQRSGLWHPQRCAGWSFNPSSLGKSLPRETIRPRHEQASCHRGRRQEHGQLGKHIPSTPKARSPEKSSRRGLFSSL